LIFNGLNRRIDMHYLYDGELDQWYILTAVTDRLNSNDIRFKGYEVEDDGENSMGSVMFEDMKSLAKSILRGEILIIDLA